MNAGIVGAALGVALSAGCAGARIDVTAERARYPLSMSGVVRDNTGRLHDRHSLEKVGTLQAGRTRVGILYSAVTLPSSYDISDDVNAQVAAARGEAVVGLTVAVEGGCDALNMFPLLNALPIWPGCVPVSITGDIVRRKPRLPAAPAPAPGTPPAVPALAPETPAAPAILPPQPALPAPSEAQ